MLQPTRFNWVREVQLAGISIIQQCLGHIRANIDSYTYVVGISLSLVIFDISNITMCYHTLLLSVSEKEIDAAYKIEHLIRFRQFSY